MGSEGSEEHDCTEVQLHVKSEQLRLKLGMPWDGVSPRCLTRGFERLSLASEGTGRSIGDAVPSIQMELFPEGTHYGS